MNIGILGTGSIARTMAAEFTKVPAFRCEAVCSRQQATGEALAQQFGIPKVYTDYDAMLADPDIELVYIATPNSLHYAQTKAALLAGKNVLCEKPFVPTVVTYNYVNTNGGTDGFFGSGSANATVYFQNSEGLDPDGKVGSLTWMKIGERLKDEDGWDSDAPHYWYPNDIGVDISNTRVIIYVEGYRSVTRSGTAKEVFYR